MFKYKSGLSLTVLATALATPVSAWAATPVLPTRPSYDRAQIALTTSGKSMGITQTGKAAAIEWGGFSIGQGYSVNITQPSTSAILVNRVVGTAASQIDGKLTANGQVFLINPNGITIGPTGVVTTNGFVASTLDIGAGSSGDPYFLTGSTDAGVSVAGTLTGKGASSYIVLAGGTVSVARTARINANNVGLASASSVLLRLPAAREGFGLQTTNSATASRINISGNINATNGALVLDAGELADAAVNVDGIITASQTKVSITVGSDERAAGLRVGNALKSTSAGLAPGQIRFTGKNQAASALSINGYDYTLLWTKLDLLAVNVYLDGHYALANDLSYADDAPITNALIGAGEGDSDGLTFTGQFNGLGHKLEGIVINGDANRELVGLFAAVNDDAGLASISNLNLVSMAVTGASRIGKSYMIGGVVGQLGENAVLQNVFVSGAVKGSGTFNIGGLAGEASGQINHSGVDITVEPVTTSSQSVRNVGGLVGVGYGPSVISNSVARGRMLGGMMISSQSIIGSGTVGGIIGFTAGQVLSSHAYATVLGGQEIGGIAGSLYDDALIESSSFEGSVSAFDFSPNVTIGGIAGFSQNAWIQNSSAKGTIKALGIAAQIGGLVGFQMSGAVTNSTFDGTLLAGSATRNADLIAVGGIAGSSADLARVGARPPQFLSNVAKVRITGGDFVRAGGLVGALVTGSVQNSMASGTIQVGRRSIAGGLFGSVAPDSPTVSEQASAQAIVSTVQVTGGANSYVGGLAGRNQGVLSNAYATGALSGGTGAIIGALVGVQGPYGVVQNAITLTGRPGQSQLNLVGGGVRGRAGVTRNASRLTDAQLRSPSLTRPILGTEDFTFPSGNYPTLKRPDASR